MIKIIKYTLLGVIGTIIVALLFNHIFGVELQSFAFFFILPVGGLYIGIGGASGLFYGHFRYKESITYKQYLLALILAIVTFYGVYYASYLTTYVTSSNQVNIWFKGEHISNFKIDDEKITFPKYLELQKSSGEYLIGFSGVVSPTSISTGKVINKVSFYLQLFGALLGSIGVGLYFHMRLEEKPI